MRQLTCTGVLFTISLVQCVDHLSQFVTTPSKGLVPPFRDAPQTFQKHRRSVKAPSNTLEPPLDEEPANFLGNEISKEVSMDPVHYLIPPAHESKYADFVQPELEDLKQALAPPTQQEPQPFRDPANIEQSINSTLPPVALPGNGTSKLTTSHTGNGTATSLKADRVIGGNVTDDGGDRSKRFVWPSIFFDYGGGGCCDVCGRCGDDFAARRRFRPRGLRRGRRRRVGRRFLPVYDDYDYDYGGGCGGCGRK